MMEFDVRGEGRSTYIALPEGGRGPGVLVLHAWWGLTPVFRGVCDRLAAAGIVAAAPDLYGGATAGTQEEAQRLLSGLDVDATRETVLGAARALGAHPAVAGSALGTVGFSMGASWAILLAEQLPAEIAATVLFYGTVSADFTAVRSRLLGHFGEQDEWEPLDGVRQMEADMRAAGRDVTVHTYPAGHWFFEEDRPEHYHPDAAALAWERTVAFLRDSLRTGE